MRILFTITLLSIIKICTAQSEMPTKEGKVVFEYIDSNITAPAGEIHNRAKMWFADAFRDSKEVIQVDNKDNGILMGKGNLQFDQALVPFLIRFSVKVDSRDGKYRVQFYDITYREGTRGFDKNIEQLNEKKGREKLKNNIIGRFNDLIASIKGSISISVKSNDF